MSIGDTFGILGHHMPTLEKIGWSSWHTHRWICIRVVCGFQHCVCCVMSISTFALIAPLTLPVNGACVCLLVVIFHFRFESAAVTFNTQTVNCYQVSAELKVVVKLKH